MNFGYLVYPTTDILSLKKLKDSFLEGDQFCVSIFVVMRKIDWEQKILLDLKDIGYGFSVYSATSYTNKENKHLYHRILKYGGEEFINNRPNILKEFNKRQ